MKTVLRVLGVLLFAAPRPPAKSIPRDVGTACSSCPANLRNGQVQLMAIPGIGAPVAGSFCIQENTGVRFCVGCLLFSHSTDLV